MSIYFAVCQTKLQIVQSKLKKGVTVELDWTQARINAQRLQ